MNASSDLTQDQIRALFAADDLHVQIATEGDGNPDIARGDTFVFIRDAHGTPKKMPFATIVTKDYPGFDEASHLNRGLFRLNLDIGRAAFTERFGFAPSELDDHRADFDFSAPDRIFPHPVYGAYGWVSVIQPRETRSQVEDLIRIALERARRT